MTNRATLIGQGSISAIVGGADDMAATSLYLAKSGNLADIVDAGAARTNLGLEIGVDVQSYDADLAAIAALVSAGLIARTGAGTAAARTLTGTANQVNVSNGDGVSGNPTLSLPQNIHSAATPTFGGLTLSSPLTVPNGGLGIGSGSSGGVPFFSASNTIASSAALGSTYIVTGGGAGATPVAYADFRIDSGGKRLLAAPTFSAQPAVTNMLYANPTYSGFTASGEIIPVAFDIAVNNVNLSGRELYGTSYQVFAQGTTTDTARVAGLLVRPYQQGSGALTTFAAVVTDPYVYGGGASGAVTTMYGLMCGSGVYGGGATSAVTDWRQIQIKNPATGTNRYGIVIDAISGGGGVNYAIYSAGGQSYHAGALQVGDVGAPVTSMLINTLRIGSDNNITAAQEFANLDFYSNDVSSGATKVAAAIRAKSGASNWSSVNHTASLLFYTISNGTFSEKWRIADTGQLSNTGASGTAGITLSGGGTAANTQPLKFTHQASGATSAEAGTLRFTTDKLFLGITTGPAEKEITLNDAALTSGRFPGVTTNGRLIDYSGGTWDGATLTTPVATHTLSAVIGASNTTGFPLTLDSTHANGSFVYGLRSGATKWTIGGGKHILGSLAVDDIAIDSTAGKLELCTGSAQRVEITGTTAAFPVVGTTASAANAFLDNSSAPANSLLRSTSSLRFKRVLSDLTLDDARNVVFGSKPIVYQSKSPHDNWFTEHVGFGAEQVAKIDDRFVTRARDASPDWVQYPAYVAPLCLVAADLHERVTRLERQLNL